MRYVSFVISCLVGLLLIMPGVASASPNAPSLPSQGTVTIMAQANQGVLPVEYIAPNSPIISQVAYQANNSVNRDILNYDGKEGTVTFNYDMYHKLEPDDQKTFMQTALGATSKSGLEASRKNKLYNFISAQDGTVAAAVAKLSVDSAADFYTASTWLQPFSDPMSTFMGLLCILLFVLMSFSIIFDLTFITIPILRSSVSDGGLGTRFVSADARYAVKEEDSSGRMAIATWTRRRLISLLILSVLLLYLVTGSLLDIVGWFLNVFHIR